MLEPKEPDPLIEARELFRTENYELSKKYNYFTISESYKKSSMSMKTPNSICF